MLSEALELAGSATVLLEVVGGNGEISSGVGGGIHEQFEVSEMSVVSEPR